MCSFENTGIEEVDDLLYALQCASDHFHNSKNWDQEWYPESYGLTGDTPVEAIQELANKLAKVLKKK